MSKKNIEEASQKIALLKEKAKSAKSEKVKKSIEARIATIQKETKEQEQITGKELAQSVIKSRKKFMTMSDEDFNKIIKTLSGTPEYSFLKGMTRDEIVRDLQRKAKPVGWRFKGKSTKVPTKKQRGKAGTYYENRENRSDVNRSRQLEQGGSVGTGGTSDSAMDMDAPTIGGTMASSMAKGGNLEALYYLDEYEESNDPKIAEEAKNIQDWIYSQKWSDDDGTLAKKRDAKIKRFEQQFGVKVKSGKMAKGGNVSKPDVVKKIVDRHFKNVYTRTNSGITYIVGKNPIKSKNFDGNLEVIVGRDGIITIEGYYDDEGYDEVLLSDLDYVIKSILGITKKEKGGNVNDLKIGDKIKYYDDRMERWSTAEVEEKLQNGNWGVRDKFSRFSITPNLKWEKLHEESSKNKKKRFGMFEDGGNVNSGWCYVIFKTSDTVSNPAVAPSTVAYEDCDSAERFAESIENAGGIAMVTDLSHTKMKKGGGLGFKGIQKQVAKNYEGKNVPSKYQNEYGKRYSRKEAMEVGAKIAGKIKSERQMESGGAIEHYDNEDDFKFNH